jgi:excinuclease ABC subunit C
VPDPGDDPLAERARDLPREPGVYTFVDADGEPLYIGKAADLRDRVTSYFTGGAHGHGPRIDRMLDQADGIETVLVDSEAEAYLLESSLIKEKGPRYNVRLTDDKRYPWILVSDEDHPRVDIVRDRDEDGDYFGPFPDVGTARELVNLLREAFGIRDCPRELPDGCIKHEMGLCMAPCFRDVEAAYAEAVEQVTRVLRGDPDPALAVLEDRMETAAEERRYERAARLRDRIQDIEALLEEQAIFASRREDRDAVAIDGTPERSVAVVLPRRSGRIVDQQDFELPGHAEEDREDLLAEFLARYYEDRPQVPHRILVPELPRDADALADALSTKAGRKVRFRVPQRGVGRRMLDLAEKNAGYKLAQLQTERGPDPGVVDLQERLSLDGMPRRIEGVDVSHHGGEGRVAGLVTFEDGHADRSGYRRFDLDDDRNDDVDGIREVVRRRLRRLAEEGRPLPDVLLVDGGRAQVDAARDQARELGLQPTIFGLAKDEEDVWRPGWRAPIDLPESAPGLKLLQRVRDEAHRFANDYSRRQREDQLTSSVLDDVPGVGDALRRRLLRELGSVDGVREASLEEIQAVDGVGETKARRIKSVVGDA